MAYAERTKVPVEQSINEIRRTVDRYGGDQFLHAAAHDRLIIGFTKEARMVRFQVGQSEDRQENRRLCRALLLVLKAKLEAVESGVSVFEDEFLANIVLPDGKLVGQYTRARIATAYESGDLPALLPDYSGAAE